MGIFSKKETKRITTHYQHDTNSKYVDFVCVENEDINATNIKQYIYDELDRLEADTLYEFQRTQFGFCGTAANKK